MNERNERIAALIDKMNYSGLIYQAGDYEMSVTGRDLEYFAELIVRECAGRVDNILREKKDGGGTMGDEIREHFGVE